MQPNSVQMLTAFLVVLTGMLLMYRLGLRRGSAREQAAIQAALYQQSKRQSRRRKQSISDAPIEREDLLRLMHGEKRILVIGANLNSIEVDSFEWYELSPQLDVASYDLVVVDLSPLLDTDYSGKIDIESIPKLLSFGRLVFNQNAETVFIGAPWAKIRDGRTGDELAAAKLVPAHLEYRVQRSDRVDVIDKELSEYFSLVEYTEWIFLESWVSAHFEYLATYMSEIHPRANTVAVKSRHLVSTKYAKPVAIEMHYKATYEEPIKRGVITGFPRPEPSVVLQSGPVLWLPAITMRSETSSAEHLLATRYGVGLRSRSPKWASGFMLPNERKLRRRQSEAEARVRQQEEELASLEQRADKEREYLALLYGTGDELERVVRKALAELGGTVSEPTRRGIEDGRIVVFSDS